MLTSTPYYAEANGQFEAANKYIINLIKKHTHAKSKNWHKTLNRVFWAFRTSLRESTNYTPFCLVFGYHVVLTVEIFVQSAKVQRQMEIQTDQYWNMMLDELVDVDEERLMALDVLVRKKERVAKAYNIF